MRHPFRSSLRELHSSAGLVIGWFSFFIFLFGSISLYRSEITFWFQPETHGVAPASPGLEEKLGAARSGLAYLAERAPGEEMWRIVLPSERAPLPAVAWASGEAVHEHHGMNPEVFNPADGSRVEPRDTRGGTFLYRLHVDLFGVDRGTGRKLIGMATLAMLVVLVSGVCLRTRFFRDFFLLRPQQDKTAWRDSHCVIGGVTLPFSLLFAVSGLILLAQLLLPSALYPFYRENIRSFVMESKQPPVDTQGETAEKSYHSRDLLSWMAYGIPDPARLIRLAERRWPECGAGELRIFFHGGHAVAVEAVQARGNLLAHRAVPERIVLDPASGKVSEMLKDEPPSLVRSLWYAASAIHLARFASPLPRALLFLSGVLVAGMIASGLVLWERMRERQGNSSRFLRGATAVTTTVIVGLPLAVAAFFWSNRLLAVDLPQRDVWEMLTFFFVWGGCFVHAWARPWPLARGEQLLTLGTALGLLPLLNGMTGGAALPDALWNGPWQIAGIDCAVLLLGVGFLSAGVRERRRARTLLFADGEEPKGAWLRKPREFMYAFGVLWKKLTFRKNRTEGVVRDDDDGAEERPVRSREVGEPECPETAEERS